MGQTRSWHYRSAGKLQPRSYRASAERERSARVEERAELQQRLRPAAVGLAPGERRSTTAAICGRSTLKWECRHLRMR